MKTSKKKLTQSEVIWAILMRIWGNFDSFRFAQREGTAMGLIREVMTVEERLIIGTNINAALCAAGFPSENLRDDCWDQ